MSLSCIFGVQLKTGADYSCALAGRSGQTLHVVDVDTWLIWQAHPPSRRCAKSYDELRLDKSISGCGLLSSHDDYSVIDLLPNNSALITQLR